MSSEEPVRQVPDELFRRVSAKPERAIPDALFGPPPVKNVEPEEPAESPTGESDSDESVADSGEGNEEPATSTPEFGTGAEPAEPASEPPEGVAAASDTDIAAAAPIDESTAMESAPDVTVAVSTSGDESTATVDSVDPESVPALESFIDDEVSAAAAEPASTDESDRPVLLVIADSLSYFGPKGGLPADHPKIWPNLVGAELDWDVELIGRIGWTCRDAYWALIGDPRIWAAVPRAGAVVFAVGGMDTLPSPLPTALRELIRYVRPPALRRGVRGTYNWLQPKLSKLGRPVALPPKVSVDYLEQAREALAQLRPDLPVVAVLPSVHNCAAYGHVHSGREPAVKALREWSAKTSVPLVDLGEAVREDIFSGDANPDGIHWGWAGHTAVANAMVKTLQEVR
ncbi:diglucosylglycerate octanoyltransferase [Nocardia anaemiae]|uniref:diglucosylglycerate octanoyltransferase n=1 Tax=Nocardia anaemiae TaxID=263910 RepID=UPI000AF62B70|nr:diglucosylglycerate octanoyltransferase [Nocardia anaemiae]